MKKLLFYPRLAWQGIRKNAEMVLPYLLVGMLMVGVSYIMNYLTRPGVLSALRMGETTLIVLQMGKVVVAFFSAIFLYYCNSFLIRRRMKEFGLYNILGMGKWHIACIMLWETLLTLLLVLSGGLVLGVSLSRLLEMLLIHLMHADYVILLQIFYATGVRYVVMLFGGIYVVILLANLIRMRLSNPVALLKSESAGEKPPKANWLLGVAGLVLLVAGYVLAASNKSPFEALIFFFVAVLLVILATYLLFIAGSVVLCRLLKARKPYYYKTNHFISVSSMAFRMKRNGAGMATICILCTMVLVILTSTVCLYFGTEDMEQSVCPRDMNIVISAGANGDTWLDMLSDMETAVLDCVQDKSPTNLLRHFSLTGTGKIVDGNFCAITGQDPLNITVSELAIYPLSVLEEVTGEVCTVAENELLCYPFKTNDAPDSLSFYGGTVYQLRQVFSPIPMTLLSADYSSAWSCLPLFVPDYDAFRQELIANAATQGEVLRDRITLSFDLAASAEEQADLENTFYTLLRQVRDNWHFSGSSSLAVRNRYTHREETYALFGGLFFLGMMLGPLFWVSAILIMYYKQICEGHEDASRFAVMRKVGLSDREIRRSIHSQVLTVFFTPLLLAGLHLLFALPLVGTILGAFGMHNTTLFCSVTLISFLCFALLYALVYVITAKRYYHIVR